MTKPTYKEVIELSKASEDIISAHLSKAENSCRAFGIPHDIFVTNLYAVVRSYAYECFTDDTMLELEETIDAEFRKSEQPNN